MEDTITVLGVTIRRSPVSPVSEKHCVYLTNGFCKTCTCDECEGGWLMEEWRQDIRNGGSMRGPRECKCVEKARSRKRLRDSGLERLAARCTFESFKTAKPWQQGVKKLAQDYLKDARRLSFFISGQSGCGKTHLCTAICNELIERGGSLRYFQWVRDGTRLKQLLCEGGDYEKEIRALIGTRYLYIDDLFKQEITAADIRLAYEIINGRCIAGRPTIISSERNLNYIKSARDGEVEAIAGRIFESCGHGKYCIELTGTDKNLRFET